MPKKLLVVLGALIALSEGSCVCAQEKQTAPQKQTERPNVILIYVDDMGKGMLSQFGQTYVSTPNIDKIFAKGISFNHAYGCVYCAPARASLLTGYHDCRTKPTRKFKISKAGIYKGKNFAFNDLNTLEKNIAEVEANVDATDVKLPVGDLYLPQVFKAAGYKTFSVGKNDYGFVASRQQMKNHGWDHFYGYLDHGRCHGFFPPWVFDDEKIVRIPGNERMDCAKSGEPEGNEKVRANRWSDKGKKVYSENLFLAKGLEYIRENKANPFFMMYTTTLPHGPTQVRLKPNDNPARFGDVATYPTIPEIDPEILAHTVDSTYKIGDTVPEGKLSWVEAEYAQMLKILDQSVGALMNEVEKQGLTKNTIFVFTSDNGHEIYYSQPKSSNRVNKNNYKFSTTEGTGKVYNSADCHDIFNGNWGFSGRKWSTWNGGTNVPLAFYWPGKIEGGRRSNELVTNYDFLTTMADLLKQNPGPKDGISYAKLLFDSKAKLPKDRCIFYSGQTGFEHDTGGNAGAVVRNDGYVFMNSGKKLFRLFDNSANDSKNEGNFTDKLQIKNIAKEYPEIAQELQQALEKQTKAQ